RCNDIMLHWKKLKLKKITKNKIYDKIKLYRIYKFCIIYIYIYIYIKEEVTIINNCCCLLV
ncbi:MAG: hypothetical protein MCS20_02130, partial [Candidatus Phytoplasma mali]|nr:hypothetical protein [Candidatus Phytoplasma australiense]MBZ7920166.1 hypothetical protein [Candidatus Karelsulcia muelleri]MCG7202187.1 hypothetical protein [Candidatus Phytoplasma mali]MCZ8632907.1 hypothetical protein [Spiroplasma sp. Tabriz.8]